MTTSYKHRLLRFRTGLIHKAAASFLPVEKPVLFTGPSASEQLCQIIQYHGHGKVMIVTDEVLVKLGVIAPIQQALEENNLEVCVFSEVEPDPTDKVVVKGADVFSQNNCDCVLAVGGGSSIDAAKTIASLASNPGLTVTDLASTLKVKKRAKNVYTIPTTSGTGSEVSVAAVISDAISHEKTIISVQGMMPLAAAIDTNIVKGMPASVTAATGMDAMTHAIEAFISESASPESDYYAKAAIVMIMENLPKAYHDGNDIKARELMGIAAFYAGFAFSKALLGYVHSISHRLSKNYGTPHGLANALVLPHVLEFSKDVVEERFVQLMKAIDKKGSEGKSSQALAQQFIDRITALNREVGIPATLDKLKEADIPEIAEAALKEAHFLYAVPKYMDEEECQQVVRCLLPVAETAAVVDEGAVTA